MEAFQKYQNVAKISCLYVVNIELSAMTETIESTRTKTEPNMNSEQIIDNLKWIYNLKNKKNAKIIKHTDILG